MVIGINKLLNSSSHICGGKMRIDGTRITVHQLVVLYKQGYSPEEIITIYPHLTLAQIYTALAYYHFNKNQIEMELEAEKSEAQELEAKHMNEAEQA